MRNKSTINLNLRETLNMTSERLKRKFSYCTTGRRSCSAENKINACLLPVACAVNGFDSVAIIKSFSFLASSSSSGRRDYYNATRQMSSSSWLDGSLLATVACHYRNSTALMVSLIEPGLAGDAQSWHLFRKNFRKFLKLFYREKIY